MVKPAFQDILIFLLLMFNYNSFITLELFLQVYSSLVLLVKFFFFLNIIPFQIERRNCKITSWFHNYLEK